MCVCVCVRAVANWLLHLAKFSNSSSEQLVKFYLCFFSRNGNQVQQQKQGAEHETKVEEAKTSNSCCLVWEKPEERLLLEMFAESY